MSFLKNVFKDTVPFFIKATFVFILTFLIAFGSIWYLYQNEDNPDQKTFSIQGEAKRDVEPDTAYITLGASFEGSDILKIQDEATSKVNAAIEKIKALEISEEKIKTSTFSVDQKYDKDGNLTGYTVNVAISVTIENTNTEADKAGDVIEAGLESGLNEVRNLSFDISNRDEIVEELKLEAIEDAKSKKDDVSKASGIKLGGLVNISYSSYYPYYYNSYGEDTANLRESSPQVDLEEDIQINPGET
ncbi:MAG TPA: SIMPL domain-containing protein, partial [Candidatus Dojkabacteria bacterium]